MVKFSIFKKTSANLFFSKKSKLAWSVGLGLFSVTALINIGIIAIDDYACIIARIIPAQSVTFENAILERDIRSPFVPLVLLIFTKLGFYLGIEDPTNQLRFVLVLIGLFNFCVFSFLGTDLVRGKTGEFEKETFLCLLGFYFLSPLIFTRPLIESLSAPFIMLSCWGAYRYWNYNIPNGLIVAVISVAIAAMFRFQSGICFFSILILVALKNRVKDYWLLIGISLLAFLVSGGIDSWLIGTFHGSLVTYLKYNLNYSNTFGVTPFYTFILLLIGLSFPPSLIGRYRSFSWRSEYRVHLPAVLFLGVFLFSHSLVPHKEERFMIPILPIYLVLLVPLLRFWSEKNSRSWRLKLFWGGNLILLPLTSFNIPQNNTISLVRFLSQHTHVRNIVSIEDTLVLYPKAFSLNPPELLKLSLEDTERLGEMGCSVVVAVRQDYEKSLIGFLSSHKKVTEFRPGPLEELLVKVNPKQNLRRGTISLYVDSQCLQRF